MIQQYLEPILSSRLFQCAVTVLIAFIIERILNKKIIQKIYIKTIQKRDDLRYDTLFSVLKKIVTGAVAFFAILQLIQILFRVNPASVIAATGVVGVAVGLASQSLIKDAINGFLILFENQYAIGELVTVEGFTGTVEEITLRITKIKNVNGDLFIIPNSSITKVINHSRFERGILTGVYISYEENIESVIQVLTQTAKTAKQEMAEITETPEVLGVAELGSSGVLIKMLVKCQNGAQFSVEREMLKRMKNALDEAGIEIPYEHVVIINAEQEK